MNNPHNQRHDNTSFGWDESAHTVTRGCKKIIPGPEFQEPVIIRNPPYPYINPDYLTIAQIAYDTVLQTMIEGELKHGVSDWKSRSADHHKRRALKHAEKAYSGDQSDKHVGNCLTRCAMIKYLETR